MGGKSLWNAFLGWAMQREKEMKDLEMNEKKEMFRQFIASRPARTQKTRRKR
jgi:hypothetical protein